MNCGFRVLLLEFCNQLAQGFLLLWCACIARLKGVIIAANIANTYGVGIVAGAVCSGFFYGAACVDGSVQVNYVVVAYLFKSTLAVPDVYVFYCVMAAGWGGAAMDYDFCYLSHCLVFRGLWIIGYFLVLDCNTVTL